MVTGSTSRSSGLWAHSRTATKTCAGSSRPGFSTESTFPPLLSHEQSRGWSDVSLVGSESKLPPLLTGLPWQHPWGEGPWAFVGFGEARATPSSAKGADSHARFPASSERKLQQQNGIATVRRTAMKLRNWALRRIILGGSIPIAHVLVKCTADADSGLLSDNVESIRTRMVLADSAFRASKATSRRRVSARAPRPLLVCGSEIGVDGPEQPWSQVNLTSLQIAAVRDREPVREGFGYGAAWRACLPRSGSRAV